MKCICQNYHGRWQRQDQKTQKQRWWSNYILKARKFLVCAVSRTSILIHWAKKNTQTFQTLLDKGSVLTWTPGELSVIQAPVSVGEGGQVIKQLLVRPNFQCVC